MSLQVKTKFVCESVSDYGNLKAATLRAVTNGSEENKSFSKFTPGDQVQVTVDSETAAADFFKPKKEYLLTFEESVPVFTEA